MSEETVLELRQITKRYPGTLAVDSVDMSVRAGEVHALMGENGAGKSSLVKLIAGSFNDYTGQVLLGGEEVNLHSPAIAKSLGIELIHQELSLAPPLSLAENIMAGRLPKRKGLLDRKAMRTEAANCLKRVGLDLHPDTLVEDISQHEAQLVEIAKALGNHPKILVMDEPTSSLSREEVKRLFKLVKQLRSEGLSIIYISHHLPEIMEIADRVTVLRDGKKVATRDMKDVTSAEMVQMMVGRSVSELYDKRKRSPGKVRLSVQQLSRYGFFHQVSFDVREGEILGIGGLSGAGRSELVRSICGIDPIDDGQVLLDDEDVTCETYQDNVRNGFAYLTEDRKNDGVALRLSVDDNMRSASLSMLGKLGFYLPTVAKSSIKELIQKLQISPPISAGLVGNLSGGNQTESAACKMVVE